MGDSQLVRLGARGDQRALSEIFERHHQALYRYCRSLVNNDTDAQDALQNTMVRVVRALPGEEREISLKAWLYRIAHNESLRIVQTRRSHEPLDEVPELAAPDETASAEARERLAMLVADLRELPERARSAVVLRELNGASFQEIGDSFGISPAAAKQAVYEARIALQDFEAGRALDCDDVTRAVSDGDGRRLRQRKMRAHLRACDDCRAFQAALERRGADFRALAPPLGPAVAAGLLADLLGGSGGSGTAAAAGVAAGNMTTVAVAVAVKGVAVAAVTVATGAGVLHATTASGPPARKPLVAQTASAQQTIPLAHSTAVARHSRPETSRQPTRRAENRRRASEQRRRKRAASGSRDTQAIGSAGAGHTAQGGPGTNPPRRVAAPQAVQDKRGVPVAAPAPNPRVPPTATSPAPVRDVGIEAPVPSAAPTLPAPAPASTPSAPVPGDGVTSAPENFSK